MEQLCQHNPGASVLALLGPAATLFWRDQSLGIMGTQPLVRLPPLRQEHRVQNRPLYPHTFSICPAAEHLSQKVLQAQADPCFISQMEKLRPEKGPDCPRTQHTWGLHPHSWEKAVRGSSQVLGILPPGSALISFIHLISHLWGLVAIWWERQRTGEDSATLAQQREGGSAW